MRMYLPSLESDGSDSSLERSLLAEELMGSTVFNASASSLVGKKEEESTLSGRDRIAQHSKTLARDVLTVFF